MSKERTAERTAEQIAVMQAYIDGKTIQMKEHDPDDTWVTIMEPIWDWFTYDYRVKQEPREFWLNIYPTYIGWVYPDKESADHEARPNRAECIQVREVLNTGF